MHALKKIDNTIVSTSDILMVTEGHQVVVEGKFEFFPKEGCTIHFKNKTASTFKNISLDKIEKILLQPSTMVENTKTITGNTSVGTQTSQKPLTILSQIAAERERQKLAEGYTEKHDDTHTAGELAAAAACYAMPKELHDIDSFFPFREGIRRKDRRKDLIRATALMIAEIERFDRAEAKAGK